MQVGASRDKKRREQSGRPKGPSVLPSRGSPRKPTKDPAPRSRLWLPETRGAANSRKGRCGRPALLAPNFRNPTHPQEPDACCPWARKPGWRNFGGNGDSPEGDPDAAGEIRGPRREAEIGCGDAALATVQRRRSAFVPRGAESPLRPGPNSARSEVPLRQDLLSLAVCARAEGGADRWASASAARRALQ